jgi:hypothetical protein
VSKRLETEFDSLFTLKTGYEELDKRITKTQAKKESSRTSVTQQYGRTWGKAASTQTGRQFWAANSSRGARLGYFCNPGRHFQEVGRELLPIYSRPDFRCKPDPANGGSGHKGCKKSQFGPVILDSLIPRIIEMLLTALFFQAVLHRKAQGGAIGFFDLFAHFCRLVLLFHLCHQIIEQPD